MTKIKRKCFFVRKRLKQALMLVGILIITLAFSGCEKLVETDVGAETKSTIQTVSETTVPVNQEETQFVTEFEITDWTMEELVTDMEIEGQKFSLPCSIAQLNKSFNVNNIRYSEKYDHTVADLYYKNEYISQVTVNKNINDRNYKNKNIMAFFIGGANSIPQFNIMGITNDSTQDDIVNILGNSNIKNNEINQPYRYFFNENEHIIIDFDENNKIWLFFIIYSVEE